jgi:hypothetical protein
MTNRPKYRPASDREKLDLILDLLQGNPIDEEDHGLVGEVRTLRTETDELKRFKDRTIYWIAGFVFLGGPVFAYLITIIIKK